MAKALAKVGRSAVLGAMLVLAAGAADAQTHGYRVVRRPRLALAITGAGVFVTGYALSAITLLTPQAYGDSWNAIPIAGPWIMLARDARNVNDDILFAAQGILQITGAVLFAIGIVPREMKINEVLIDLNASGVAVRF